MRVDLHIHTTASDGAWSPEKVVHGARAGGLDLIAITDHDTTAAFEEAHRAGMDARVQVAPAIELSATHNQRDVHVLGYFIDPRSSVLINHRSTAGERRENRMREMVGRLHGRGLRIAYDDVLTAAGPGRGSIGRPHLARALVANGEARSVQDAFNRLIGDNRPGYVPVAVLTPVKAVELVLAAGGLPVWAHPPFKILDECLPRLVGAGLRGLEVYRPSHSPGDVIKLEELCRAHGLLMSGGSDWHSPDSGHSIGDYYVDAYEIEPLLEEGGF